MAVGYYAWAPIHHFKDGKPLNVKPGDGVNKEDFTDEDWAYFLSERLVRDQEYPKDIRLGESPMRYHLRKASEAFEAASEPQREVNAPAPLAWEQSTQADTTK